MLPDPAVGIGGTIVANVAAPRNGDGRATGLGIKKTIVGFRERAVIHPEVAHRAAIADRDEIPIVPVVLSLGVFVPFKVLVEFQIANDDVVAAFDIEVAMFDGRAVGGENGQPALGLDVDQTLTNIQENRVQQRQGILPERADGLHRCADLIPTQTQIVHDLDDLDRASGLVGRLEGIGEIEWSIDLHIREIVRGNHTTASCTLCKAGQVICGVDQRYRGRHGQLGGIAGCTPDIVGGGESVTAVISRLHIRQAQGGGRRARNRRSIFVPLITDGGGAARDGGEAGSTAGQHHQRSGLGIENGRHGTVVDGKESIGAIGGSGRIVDDDGITSRIRELNIGDRQNGIGGIGQHCIGVIIPLVAERITAAGLNAEGGGCSRQYVGLILRLSDD